MVLCTNFGGISFEPLCQLPYMIELLGDMTLSLCFEIHVFYQDRFLCRAICAELNDRKVSLKGIEKVRSERHKQVRAGLGTRAALVDRYVEIYNPPPPAPKTVVMEPAPVEARPRLKRYIND